LGPSVLRKSVSKPKQISGEKDTATYFGFADLFQTKAKQKDKTEREK
jgi:hypothetical protein